MAEATSSQVMDDGKYPPTVGGVAVCYYVPTYKGLNKHTWGGGHETGRGILRAAQENSQYLGKRSEGRAGRIVDSVLGQLLSLLSCALAPRSLSLPLSLSLC